MRQSIYVLAMTLYPVFFENEHSMEDHLVGYSSDGCLIHACHYYSDPYIYQILENLNQNNNPPVDDTKDYVNLTYEFFELVIESDQNLRYRTLPWLNDRIRSYYSVDENINAAGYFFYIIGEEKNPSLEIVARLKTHSADLNETNSGDNFSYILGLAKFIDRYIYYNDAEEHFADTMAKIILQFGE